MMKASKEYRGYGFNEAVYTLMDVAESNGFDVEVADNADEPELKDVIMSIKTEDDDVYSFSVVVDESTEMRDITDDLYCEWQNFDPLCFPIEGERLVGEIYRQMSFIENFGL